MKLRGVISFRNDLPICAMPNGSLRRIEFSTFSKFTKMPCAVSGRRYTVAASSSTGPTNVRSIRLNIRGSVNWPRMPQFGQTSESSSSARKRPWQFRQSTIGSVNVST